MMHATSATPNIRIMASWLFAFIFLLTSSIIITIFLGELLMPGIEPGVIKINNYKINDNFFILYNLIVVFYVLSTCIPFINILRVCGILLNYCNPTLYEIYLK